MELDRLGLPVDIRVFLLDGGHEVLVLLAAADLRC